MEEKLESPISPDIPLTEEEIIEIKRDDELLKFIDELISSEEYEEYLQKKRKLISKGVQYDIRDIPRPRPPIVKIDQIMKKSIAIRSFIKLFNQFCRNEKNAETVRGQEKTIDNIRSRIREAKRLFSCHKADKRRRINERRDTIFMKYVTRHAIDLERIPPGHKYKEKVLSYNAIMQKRKKEIKEREEMMRNIIKKLVNEHVERQRKRYPQYRSEPEKPKVERPKAPRPKAAKPKAATPKSPSSEEPQTPAKSEEKPRSEPQAAKEKQIEEIFVQRKFSIKRKSIVSRSKFQLSKLNMKNIKIDPNISKASKNFSSDGKSKDDTKVKFELPLELPEAPQANLREKITQDLIKMQSLIHDFDVFEDMIETRYFNSKPISHICFPADNSFVSKPKVVTFKNCTAGTRYKIRFQMLNVSKNVRKIRFVKIELKNPYDTFFFVMELKGIEIAYPGLPLSYTISYIPESDVQSFSGSIVFISYFRMTCQTIEVPLECVPLLTEMNISPKSINFGIVPIWECCSHTSEIFRYITISSKSPIPHKVVIRKSHEYWNETQPVTPKYVKFEAACNESNSTNQISFLGSEENVNSSTELSSFVDELMDDVYTNFVFDDLYLNFDGVESKRLKVTFKNVDVAGYHFEKFFFEIFRQIPNDDYELVEEQEVRIVGEVLEHFVRVDPDTVDLGICNFDSSYQNSFEVTNNSKYHQCLSVKVPRQLKDYISVSNSELYLGAGQTRRIWVRFLPRKEMLTDYMPLLNKDYQVLEFPVTLYVKTKKFEELLPVKVIVYAIVSEPSDLVVIPQEEKHVTIKEGGLQLDMGTSTINEYAITGANLINNTVTTQYYCFVDLPKNILIHPNYGMGKIGPMEKKEISIIFLAKLDDICNHYVDPLNLVNNLLQKITVISLASVGRRKKVFNQKRLSKALKDILVEIKKPFYDEFRNEMQICCDTILCHFYKITKSEAIFQVPHFNSRTSLLDSREEQERRHTEALMEESCVEEESETFSTSTTTKLKQFASNRLWLRMLPLTPVYELSHQKVEMPETPCGSYSKVEIYLRPLRETHEKCVCGFDPRTRHVEYIAKYSIIGGSNEILIEPTDGNLNCGESIKLTIVAQPQLPEHVIRQMAMIHKHNEILHQKLEELKQQKELSLEKNLGKSSKSQRSLLMREFVTIEDIIVEPRELVLTYLDMYPAELALWRTLEPSFISAGFMCKVEYTATESLPDDVLFLEVMCKVVRPDFVHDFKTQRLDFGTTALGTSSRIIINIQNISYNYITPDVSLLNPCGPFACYLFDKPLVPPEHSLHLPVTFTPTSTDEELEYFEIRAGKTTVPLIFMGRGEEAILSMQPIGGIYRVHTLTTQLTSCWFKVSNASEMNVSFHVEKVAEMEGIIKRRCPSVVVEPKGKQKKSSKESAKAAAEFSHEFTGEELASLMVDFKKSASSHFDCTSEEIVLQPGEKGKFQLRFGDPQVFKDEYLWLHSAKKKKLPKPKKVPKKVFREEEETFVAKFNVIIGSSKFFEDVVLMGTFC